MNKKTRDDLNKVFKEVYKDKIPSLIGSTSIFMTQEERLEKQYIDKFGKSKVNKMKKSSLGKLLGKK
jgi:hypothetical protein